MSTNDLVSIRICVLFMLCYLVLRVLPCCLPFDLCSLWCLSCLTVSVTAIFPGVRSHPSCPLMSSRRAVPLSSHVLLSILFCNHHCPPVISLLLQSHRFLLSPLCSHDLTVPSSHGQDLVLSVWYWPAILSSSCPLTSSLHLVLSYLSLSSKPPQCLCGRFRATETSVCCRLWVQCSLVHNKTHISIREQTNILVCSSSDGTGSAAQLVIWWGVRGDKHNYSEAITEQREKTPDLCISAPFKCLMSHWISITVWKTKLMEMSQRRPLCWLGLI